MSSEQPAAGTSTSRPARLLRRLVHFEPGEAAPMLWSFAYFFCLLSSYYTLRPVRDEMGIAGGVGQLQWLFTATFVVMLAAVPLFGAASARLPRRRLLPLVYVFFIVNLLVFHALLGWADTTWTARAFFVWTSVFNLFVVSVFWSFMADLFTDAQAKRIFAFIAAGGTLGAIVGPMVTATLATQIGTRHLLLISVVLLAGALICILRLLSLDRDTALQPRHGALGGSVWEGFRLVLGSRYLLGIGAFIWLYTTLSTFLYFEQAHIVRAAFDDPDRRTQLFAAIDLAVNTLTVMLQIAITGRLLERFGVATTLALIPGLLALGFVALAVAPVITVLFAVQVLRRAGEYAITRPSREVLFTVVERRSKYKAKNFIDTVIYRGGDAVSGWLFAGLKAAGLGLTGIALVAAPIALLWMWLAIKLGRAQRQFAATPRE
ncbi:MAG: NTP/NDP exchange transporter [Thiotrichales bacterium]